MRSPGLIVLACTALACGAPVSAPEPAPSAIAPEPVSVPEPPPPSPQCTSVTDCIVIQYARPFVTESDCACMTCEGTPMNLAEADAISASFTAVCAAWSRTHPCERLSCPGERNHTLLCVRGQCILAPVVESGSAGAVSPCRTPADCPMHVYCTVGALGGPIGCTNEECTELSECSNGCATDADCPPVSPVCRGSTCGPVTPPS